MSTLETANETLVGCVGAASVAPNPAAPSQFAPVESDQPQGGEKLTQILDRIREITAPPQEAAPAPARQAEEEFKPREPRTLEEADLTPSGVEGLILKTMFSRGDLTGRQLSDQVKLPFLLI